MSLLLAICLYLRYREFINHFEDRPKEDIHNNNNNIMMNSYDNIFNRNLTSFEWKKLINHPFNENEW